MTVEQKKISLINWITTLEDEVILDQLAGFKKSSLDELPGAIVQLLKIAESEPDENLVKHTSAKDISQRFSCARSFDTPRGQRRSVNTRYPSPGSGSI